MKKKELVFIVLLAGGMLGPGIWIGIVSGYWHLLWVFLTFFACFGFWEWHAKKTTNKTVSQQFWKFAENHPIAKWIAIGAMVVSWLALMYHFAF